MKSHNVGQSFPDGDAEVDKGLVPLLRRNLVDAGQAHWEVSEEAGSGSEVGSDGHCQAPCHVDEEGNVQEAPHCCSFHLEDSPSHECSPLALFPLSSSPNLNHMCDSLEIEVRTARRRLLWPPKKRDVG